MSLHLRINELVVVTEHNRYPYRFGPGINTILGEIGSGKSSMLELIKYALGGNATLTPAVEAGVRRVALTAVVGTSTVVLSREIGGRTVDALDLDGTLIERLSVAETKAHRRASSFLLERLDLPQLRVTNVRPTARSQPLSFYDIYAYCYLPQAEIDRSVVNHLENTRRAKRVGAFELVLGLTDESVSEAKVQMGVLDDKIAEERRPLDAIDRFLEEAGTPTAEQLALRKSALEALATDAAGRLESLRSESLAATVESSELRGRLASLAKDVSEAAQRVHELDAEAAQHKQLQAQLAADLQRLDRARSAQGLLGEIAYRQCPRCLQAVVEDRFAHDRCYLCGQAEPAGRSQELSHPDPVAEAERRRIESLMAEVGDLAERREQQLEAELGRQRAATAALHEMEVELDRQTRELVSPRFEALEAASAELAAARIETEEVGRLLQLWSERDRYAQRVKDLETELEDVRVAHEAAVARLAERKARVHELSGIFDEIIQALDMPWYQEGAYIDATSYLPIVNGVSIEALGSGGMKMMTNVAYHLALLTYGLSTGLDTVPDLLIIDSPRKNLGATDEDQAHAGAFYRWITALTDAYADRFQLIIADNDPPDAGTPVSSRIDLSHERPLVQDLPHPGEGVETIG